MHQEKMSCMRVDSKLADIIAKGGFIVTAEILPVAEADGSTIEAVLKQLGASPLAINVADNCHNIGMSSIAASVAVLKSGAEPICQIVTRDRNRIALQSDLLGAAYLGIRNVLCLSGYHQTLSVCKESANVYDIDSTQLIKIVSGMSDSGILADGSKIKGQFSMLVGAAANPFQRPMELNMLRMQKKIEAGAKFFQTSAVFDIDVFGQWLDAAVKEGIAARAAILAGVVALDCADEAQRLRKTYTDYAIPDSVIDRLKKAGDEASQKKEGLSICLETIRNLKKMKGLRGIHIHCGHNGKLSPEVTSSALA
jgi:methylenetetrahydrofolate reductase (NADPH)